MKAVTLKNKIQRSLEKMDSEQLKSAWLILKALSNQQKYLTVNINKTIVDKKIAAGIEQLENGEGSDFGLFLNETEVKYGKKQ
ncbi:MAG: hypothetical protein JST58_11020 [Bacteroidetes bacterium]|nr:hypothetical protein [Bacteroidota bacterium]